MGIEKQTADVVLEKKHRVEIGGIEYNMPQPTLATMIMVSEYAAELPDLFDKNLSIIDWAMHNADKARTLARIVAIFVLGCNRIREGHKIPVECTEMGKKSKILWFRVGGKVKKVTKFVDEVQWIEDLIVEMMTPKELALLLYQCVSMLEVKDFFAVTASLSGVNLLKSTEAVIASGD